MKRVHIVIALSVLALTVTTGAWQTPSAADRLTAEVFEGFELRSIGPSVVTGRVADFDVDPKNPSVYWVATAAGGLWKSVNRGRRRSRRSSIAADRSTSAASRSIRRTRTSSGSAPARTRIRAARCSATASTSRPTAARRGRASGLANSEHLGNIQIDPRDSNVVYVTSQGPLWSSGGDRGVYKTTDGGKTWTAILTVGPDTGANELVIDPAQSRHAVRVDVAAPPRDRPVRRRRSGERDLQVDERRQDVDEARRPGCPRATWAASISRADGKVKPTRVYAMIEALAPERGFYRSDDAGATWARVGKRAPGAGRGGGARRA